MFLPFLAELRRRKVPVGVTEAVQLARALTHGLHDSSLDGFYHVARALLVHSERHLAAFDQAFLAHFKGVESQGKALAEELLEWLEKARSGLLPLTQEERALLQALDPEALRRLFEERLREQRERHDGGSRWIGTAGTSPFGNQGRAAQPGFRVGGSGKSRGAMVLAEGRRYERYRDDVVLDTRQLGLALRKLRAFSREGAAEELDVEGTIDATAKNAGDLEVITRPPRRPNTRIILMMDVGGSMTPYAHLVSRLFSASKKATHFKDLRTFYFHNCIYGRVYDTEKLDQGLTVPQLMGACGRHYKLVLAGDALMAPYELYSPWGASALGGEAPPGIAWLMQLAEHFSQAAWLNPEPASTWRGNTIEAIARVFAMFPLTLEGLGEAVSHLTHRMR